MRIAFVRQDLDGGKAEHYGVVTPMETIEEVQRDLDGNEDDGSSESAIGLINTGSIEFVQNPSVQDGFKALEAMANASEDSVRAALEELVTVAFTKGMRQQAQLIEQAIGDHPEVQAYLKNWYESLVPLRMH